MFKILLNQYLVYAAMHDTIYCIIGAETLQRFKIWHDQLMDQLIAICWVCVYYI